MFQPTDIYKQKTMIYVRFQRKGFHHFPNAPEQVAYLGDRHRHLFKFEVGIQVEHDDREIEFHMFQEEIENLFEGNLEIDNKSCEMLARDIGNYIVSKYPGRIFYVDVSEDGECGSRIDWEPVYDHQ